MPATTLPWHTIDTVILDMDGTLLDLAFDNYFWRQLVPVTLSQQRNIPLSQALHFISEQYDSVQHTLNWYCLDYWSEQLQLDLYQMKKQIQHQVTLREDSIPFLDALRQSGRKTILLTNAHPHSLSVKISATGLDKHLDLLLSTHTYGYPKEDLRLWQAVQQETQFAPQHTLFVDDVVQILQVAQQFGILSCLGVTNPDSTNPEENSFDGYPSVNDYCVFLPKLKQSSRV